MDNDINQKILEELQKLRKTIQWTSVVSVLALVGVCLWAFSLVHARQASPWVDVAAAMRQYDYPKALKLTQAVVAAHPDDYYAHGYLGYIYLQAGDLAQAEAEYSRSYELWPSEETQKKLAAVRKRRESESPKTK